jgi:hypothetical protein
MFSRSRKGARPRGAGGFSALVKSGTTRRPRENGAPKERKNFKRKRFSEINFKAPASNGSRRGKAGKRAGGGPPAEKAKRQARNAETALGIASSWPRSGPARAYAPAAIKL